MLALVTHRRLKPGSFIEFRKEWSPARPPRAT